MFTRVFWADLLERAISTFAATFVAGNVISSPLRSLEAAGIAAGLGALKGLAATQLGNPGSASLVPTVGPAGP